MEEHLVESDTTNKLFCYCDQCWNEWCPNGKTVIVIYRDKGFIFGFCEFLYFKALPVKGNQRNKIKFKERDLTVREKVAVFQEKHRREKKKVKIPLPRQLRVNSISAHLMEGTQFIQF